MMATNPASTVIDLPATTISPFILKTYNLVEHASNDLVEWTNGGTSFVIKNPKELEKKVLHQYFKHSNFSSFARQLGFYNFKKRRVLARDHDPAAGANYHVEYFHSLFLRGRMDLMEGIQRKTAAATTSSTVEAESAAGSWATTERQQDEQLQPLKDQLETLANRVREMEQSVYKLIDWYSGPRANTNHSSSQRKRMREAPVRGDAFTGLGFNEDELEF